MGESGVCVRKGVCEGVYKVRRAVSRTTTNQELGLEPSQSPTHPSFFLHPSAELPKPQSNECSPCFCSLNGAVNTGLICRGARFGYINLNLATVSHHSDIDKTDGVQRNTATARTGGNISHNSNGFGNQSVCTTTKWQLDMTPFVSCLCTNFAVWALQFSKCKGG